jgi:hypothetical protein
MTTTTHETAAVEPLGLTSVLASSLPATLLTEDAPDKYLIEAIFSRQPEREESQQILGMETGLFLRQSGYPEVELRISDRRLEIDHTNLSELNDGLSTILANRLATISGSISIRRAAEASRFRAAADSEAERAQAVAELAHAVTFVPEPASAKKTDT